MNVYEAARVSMVLSRRRIPMLLASDKRLRQPARQAGRQRPQRRQMLTLRLKPSVVVEDTEGFTEVVAR